MKHLYYNSIRLLELPTRTETAMAWDFETDPEFQEQIADSWIEIEQFKLLVLRTAWKIDKYNDYFERQAAEH